MNRLSAHQSTVLLRYGLSGQLIVVQLDDKKGSLWPGQSGWIVPEKITLSLSAACHKQMNELCAHYGGDEPGRRQAMTRSEVVERAVAAYHLATIPTPGKRRT